MVADNKFSNGRHVNNLAVRRHLGQQLGLLLPEIMKYVSHRGLEVSITAEERPWRLELVWQRKNKKPLDPLWQKRIRDMLGMSLAKDSNLFLFAHPPQGSTLVTELRLEDVSPFVIKDTEGKILIPYFHNFRK